MPKKERGQTTPARKSLWGYLTARKSPLPWRHVIRVLHEDTFSRELSADEIPGKHAEPVLQSQPQVYATGSERRRRALAV
jgi:hypothetical protein